MPPGAVRTEPRSEGSAPGVGCVTIIGDKRPNNQAKRSYCGASADSRTVRSWTAPPVRSSRPRTTFFEAQGGRTPPKGQRHELVAEPGAARTVPVDRRARAAAVPGKAVAEPPREAAPAEAETEPDLRRDGVVDGGARQLDHMGRRLPGGLGPDGLGDIGVVHVPRQHAHGRRRVLAGSHVGDEVRQLLEGLRERRPVLQVRRAPQFLAEPCPARAPLPAAQRGVPRLRLVDQRRQQPRQRRADQQVVAGLRRVQGLFAQPRRLAGVEHRPVLLVQDAGRAAVDHQDPGPAEVAAVAPADRGRIGVGLCGEGPQYVRAVGRLAHRRVQRIVRELVGGEVAEVLVDPVRHQAAQDPFAPPRGRADVLEPGVAGVPVVDDVVVVEDHAAGHGGQQPADLGVQPGLVVEPGVLLVVRDLMARGVRQVPAGRYPRAGRVRDLVRVHLVAQQQQYVRAFAVRVRRDAGREGVQRVGPDRVLLVRGRRRPAAGAEGDTDRRLVTRRGADHRGREGGPGKRPHRHVVEQHLVRRHGAGRQPAHRHQRVVVARDLERRGRSRRPVRAAHLGGARAARFDPEGRGRTVDVPQQRPQAQLGHE